MAGSLAHCRVSSLSLRSSSCDRLIERIVGEAVMWRYIDCHGDISDVGQLGLRYRITGFSDQDSAVDWVVRNIGVVMLAETDRFVRVRLRPSKTPPKAFGAALYQLATAGDLRASISSFGTCWEHRLFPTAGLAAEFLAKVNITQPSRGSNILQRRSIRPEMLPQGSDLQGLLERWREFNIDMTMQEILALLPPSLTERAIVLEASQSNTRLIIRHLGRGFRIFDTRWIQKAPGQDFEEQPDLRYGRWAAESYRMALQARMPIADDVDAIVDNPYAQSRNRSLYRRIIVPIPRRDGSTLLLGCSTLDSTIHLGRQAG